MSLTPVTAADLQNAIRNVPDFPKPGIQFKDITPVLADARLFAGSVELLTRKYQPGDVDAVVGIDARGFIFAAAAAVRLKAGFVPVRKKGKLPYSTHEQSYDLEYGSNTIAIHVDAVKPGARVILLDDLLATGGTAGAACDLLKKLGANILGVGFLIELGFLKGREKLPGLAVEAIITYEPRLPSVLQTILPARNYHLGHTLESGQTFRWMATSQGWEGVIGTRWTRLEPQNRGIQATVAEPVSDWSWLQDYLQTGVDLDAVLKTFPDDECLRLARDRCVGLRLLRQDPWECLASFLMSSTKQIVQIKQIVELLCERFGTAVAVPAGHAPRRAFPGIAALSRIREKDLRACKMGFRAKYLRRTVQMLAAGEVILPPPGTGSFAEAKQALLALPGVGTKIAHCVLLFAYGFQAAFPVDVWMEKVLREFYFKQRPATAQQLQAFSESHFGPHAGYAQQYLFHFIRLRDRL